MVIHGEQNTCFYLFLRENIKYYYIWEDNNFYFRSDIYHGSKLPVIKFFVKNSESFTQVPVDNQALKSNYFVQACIINTSEF